MPEISIIVPVYNVEKYIRRCLDSLLGQTFEDIEILLIDDGSKDSSGDICDEYAACDGRFRTIHKQNGGVSSARNAGLDNAVGKYIMFCDPDDYVEPTWCEKLYNAAEENGGFFACCGYNEIRIRNNTSRSVVAYSESDIPQEKLLMLYKNGFFGAVWNKIFNLSIIRQNNLKFDITISIAEDGVFLLQYLRTGRGNIGIIPITLYNYTIDNPGSLTKKMIPDHWKLMCRIFDDTVDTMSANGIDFSRYSFSYYTGMNQTIIQSINTVFAYDISLKERFSRGREILHSSQCMNSFRYGKLEYIHPVYKAILKTHSFFLVWLFHCAVKLKHKIIK